MELIYEGLSVTSIDVTPIEGTNKVKFSSSTPGRKDDDDAVFLKNVYEVGRGDFEAELVTSEEAKEMVNAASEDKKGKPLFFIHGFTVQPKSHLMEAKESAKKFDQGKFMLVPVIWPASQYFRYYTDKLKNAKGAGEGLKTLKDTIDIFPSKSILAHSMGNRVMRFAADEGFEFDNVFMMAADVRHDLFHKEYIRSTEDDNDEAHDGLLIVRMLKKDENNKPLGKVYVLTNGADYALNASNWANWQVKIGAVGHDTVRTWTLAWKQDPSIVDDEVKDHVETVDCKPHLPWFNKISHSYYFNDFAVDFYQSKCQH